MNSLRCSQVKNSHYYNRWVLLMSINSWREGEKRMEPSSFQWCPVPGQEAVGTNWHTGWALRPLQPKPFYDSIINLWPKLALIGCFQLWKKARQRIAKAGSTGPIIKSTLSGLAESPKALNYSRSINTTKAGSVKEEWCIFLANGRNSFSIPSDKIHEQSAFQENVEIVVQLREILTMWTCPFFTEITDAYA